MLEQVVYIITNGLETCSKYLWGPYRIDLWANCEDAPKTTFLVQMQVTKGLYFWCVIHAIW